MAAVSVGAVFAFHLLSVFAPSVFLNQTVVWRIDVRSTPSAGRIDYCHYAVCERVVWREYSTMWNPHFSSTGWARWAVCDIFLETSFSALYEFSGYRALVTIKENCSRGIKLPIFSQNYVMAIFSFAISATFSPTLVTGFLHFEQRFFFSNS